MVGKTEISIGDVDKTSRAVGAALGESYPDQAALNGMVNNELAAQVGRQKVDLGQRRGDRRRGQERGGAERRGVPEAAGRSGVPRLPDQLAAALVGTIKLAGGQGINDKNGQQKAQEGAQALNTAAKDIKVTVAPRFGQWSDGRLDTAISGSLSKESDQTAAKRKAAEDAAQQQQGQG